MLVGSNCSSENTYQVSYGPCLVHTVWFFDGPVVQFVKLHHFFRELVYVGDTFWRTNDVKDWCQRHHIDFQVLHVLCNSKIGLLSDFAVIVNHKIHVRSHPLTNQWTIIPLEGQPTEIWNCSRAHFKRFVLLDILQSTLHGYPQQKAWKPQAWLSTFPAKKCSAQEADVNAKLQGAKVKHHISDFASTIAILMDWKGYSLLSW